MKIKTLKNILDHLYISVCHLALLLNARFGHHFWPWLLGLAWRMSVSVSFCPCNLCLLITDLTCHVTTRVIFSSHRQDRASLFIQCIAIHIYVWRLMCRTKNKSKVLQMKEKKGKIRCKKKINKGIKITLKVKCTEYKQKD